MGAPSHVAVIAPSYSQAPGIGRRLSPRPFREGHAAAHRQRRKPSFTYQDPRSRGSRSPTPQPGSRVRKRTVVAASACFRSHHRRLTRPAQCGRCRKRKIRCSGDPGNGSPCQACHQSCAARCLFMRASAPSPPPTPANHLHHQVTSTETAFPVPVHTISNGPAPGYPLYSTPITSEAAGDPYYPPHLGGFNRVPGFSFRPPVGDSYIPPYPHLWNGRWPLPLLGANYPSSYVAHGSNHYRLQEPQVTSTPPCTYRGPHTRTAPDTENGSPTSPATVNPSPITPIGFDPHPSDAPSARQLPILVSKSPLSISVGAYSRPAMRPGFHIPDCPVDPRGSGCSTKADHPPADSPTPQSDLCLCPTKSFDPATLPVPCAFIPQPYLGGHFPEPDPDRQEVELSSWTAAPSYVSSSPPSGYSGNGPFFPDDVSRSLIFRPSTDVVGSARPQRRWLDGRHSRPRCV
jgi:hypothetical protein